jgi:hypothetical protein
MAALLFGFIAFRTNPMTQNRGAIFIKKWRFFRMKSRGALKVSIILIQQSKYGIKTLAVNNSAVFQSRYCFSLGVSKIKEKKMADREHPGQPF